MTRSEPFGRDIFVRPSRCGLILPGVTPSLRPVVYAPTPPTEEAVMARKRARKQYSLQQRKQILAVADRESLTAAQVKEKFGVTPVTYYSWRKKYGGAPRKRGRRPVAGAAPRPGASYGGAVTAQVRSEVESRVRRMVED